MDYDDREQFAELKADLDEAVKLLEAALLLRIHGDIAHMPMSQPEWDSKAEEFLRNFNAEVQVEKEEMETMQEIVEGIHLE